MKLSELRRRYSEGCSLQTLAELCDLPVEDINYALGINKPKKIPERERRNQERYEMYKRGMTTQEIAEAQGVCKRTVYEWLRRRGMTLNPRQWWNACKEQLIPLYGKGLNDQELAEALDVSRNTIYRWRREAGLPSHRELSKRFKEGDA